MGTWPEYFKNSLGLKIFFGACLLLTINIMISAMIEKKRLNPARLGNETMTEEQTITGIYVAHWEVGRFVVETGRRFFGLLPQIEKWDPIFPAGFHIPPSGIPRGPAEYFKMIVRGTLGPKGCFAHKGICTRQLTISEVLSCEKTDRPRNTW